MHNDNVIFTEIKLAARLSQLRVSYQAQMRQSIQSDLAHWDE